MARFQIGLDVNGNPDYSVAFATTGYSITMTGGSAATLSLPKGFKTALITNTPGSTLLVGPNAISSAPGGTFEARTDEVNPAARDITGMSKLYFFAVDNSTVHVSLYE